MRSALMALAVCLILMGGAIAAAPRPAAAAYTPDQVINAIYLSLRPRMPAHAGHRGARRPDARPNAPAVAGTTAARAEMLALINAERAQAGVGPLHVASTLTAVAQARSQDMIDRHYFSHHIPGGRMVFDILDRDHVQYEMAGENIALNNYIDFYPLTRTVRQTNRDLMNSPEHRANLLEPKYTQIGLGMAFEHSSGKLIVTEVFLQP